MTTQSPWWYYILIIHPLLATLLLWGYLSAVLAPMHIEPTILNIIVGVALAALVVLGWPVLVSLGLHDFLGPQSRVNKRLLAMSLICLLSILAALPVILLKLPHIAAWQNYASIIFLWVLACLSCLYILWSGARAITSLEHSGPPPLDRTLGIFLLVYFLPVGIPFLQMKLRRALLK